MSNYTNPDALWIQKPVEKLMVSKIQKTNTYLVPALFRQLGEGWGGQRGCAESFSQNKLVHLPSQLFPGARWSDHPSVPVLVPCSHLQCLRFRGSLACSLSTLNLSFLTACCWASGLLHGDHRPVPGWLNGCAHFLRGVRAPTMLFISSNKK